MDLTAGNAEGVDRFAVDGGDGCLRVRDDADAPVVLANAKFVIFFGGTIVTSSASLVPGFLGGGRERL